MTDDVTIDLNDFSGGPNWLSALGRVDRKAIRDRNRAKFFANRVPVHTPATPATTEKLRAVAKRPKKRVRVKRQKVVRPPHPMIATLNKLGSAMIEAKQHRATLRARFGLTDFQIDNMPQISAARNHRLTMRLNMVNRRTPLKSPKN
jgi:hypothetical protein